jgi:hypothetical protein
MAIVRSQPYRGGCLNLGFSTALTLVHTCPGSPGFVALILNYTRSVSLGKTENISVALEGLSLLDAILLLIAPGLF